jgi:hypothetical protein
MLFDYFGYIIPMNIRCVNIRIFEIHVVLRSSAINNMWKLQNYCVVHNLYYKNISEK